MVAHRRAHEELNELTADTAAVADQGAALGLTPTARMRHEYAELSTIDAETLPRASRDTTLFPRKRLCYPGKDYVLKEMTLFSTHNCTRAKVENFNRVAHPHPPRNRHLQSSGTKKIFQRINRSLDNKVIPRCTGSATSANQRCGGASDTGI